MKTTIVDKDFFFSLRTQNPFLPLKDVLRGMILHAILDPSVIPEIRVNDGEIAEALGISRTPVRMAIDELTNDGYLVKKKNKGAYAANPEIKEIADSYVARAMLESTAAALAAKTITQRDLKRLQATINKCNQAYRDEDLNALISYDMQFHRIILDAAGSSYLKKGHDRIDPHYRRCTKFNLFYRGFDLQEFYDRIIGGHQCIYYALSRRDSELAQIAMEHHVAYWESF